MRQITYNAKQAFVNGTKYKESNTKVIDGKLYLHDNFTSWDGFTSFVPNNYNEFFNCLQDDFERLSQIVIEFYILQNLDYDSYFQDCAEIADDLIRDYVKVVKD